MFHFIGLLSVLSRVRIESCLIETINLKHSENRAKVLRMSQDRDMNPSSPEYRAGVLETGILYPVAGI